MKKAIGVYSESAFSGVKIIGIEYGIEDKVKFVHFTDSGDGIVSTSTIKYDDTYPYFYSRKHKYYLNEFMRAAD